MKREPSPVHNNAFTKWVRTLLYWVAFNKEGDARALYSTIIVIIAAILTVTPSRYGFLNVQFNQTLAVIVPVAGTIIALALPAAQLAYTTKAELMKVSEALVKASQKSIDISNYLDEQVVKYKTVLSPMWLVVTYSIVSFVIGLLGMLGVFDNTSDWGQISMRELNASMSVWFLVAAVLWFVPLMQSAVDFRSIAAMSHLYRLNAQDEEAEKKRLADEAQPPPEPR